MRKKTSSFCPMCSVRWQWHKRGLLRQLQRQECRLPTEIAVVVALAAAVVVVVVVVVAAVAAVVAVVVTK